MNFFKKSNFLLTVDDVEDLVALAVRRIVVPQEDGDVKGPEVEEPVGPVGFEGERVHLRLRVSVGVEDLDTEKKQFV